MRKSVTFIVKVFGKKAPAIGCINSIRRQYNKDCEIVVITDSKKFKEKIETEYDGIRAIRVKNPEKFPEISNNLIKELDTEYFVYANKDSVYPPNAADEILSEKSDCMIYNISRTNKNGKFVPLCPAEKPFTFEKYMELGVSVWNNAFRTQFVVDNGLFIDDIDYFGQLMFLLKVYSLADKIRITEKVLVLRENLVKPKAISFEQFYENRKVLKKVLKRFNKKGMYSVSKKIVSDFVFDNMDVYYYEKSFFRKILIKNRIRKYICI